MRADRGATLLVTVALLTLISLSTSALVHLGGVLMDHARVRTAAEATALAAVVWQVTPDNRAELADLLARYGSELIHLEVRAPHDVMNEVMNDVMSDALNDAINGPANDPLIDREVVAAEVTVRRGRAQATARAMARETPLPTMDP